MPVGDGTGDGLDAPGFRERLRRRETLAWEALYAACEQRVRLIAYRILPARLDPEAAAQQAWVRALHYARRLDAKRAPEPWLATICVNLCMSVLRRDKSNRRALEARRNVQEAPQADVPGFEGHNPVASRVRKSVSRLSRDQQRIVYLRFACEMPFEAIAETLGVSEATVRKRLSRAYGRLRRDLGDDEALGMLEPS